MRHKAIIYQPPDLERKTAQSVFDLPPLKVLEAAQPPVASAVAAPPPVSPARAKKRKKNAHPSMHGGARPPRGIFPRTDEMESQQDAAVPPTPGLAPRPEYL